LDAVSRAGIPRHELDALLVRLPTGEHVVRIFSDEAFLQSVRRWDPQAHGIEGRPFDLDGPLAESLVLDAIPGLRDLGTNDVGRLLPGEGVRLEVHLSREVNIPRDPSASEVWLHRHDEAGPEGTHVFPGTTEAGDPAHHGYPETGRGGVTLHLDDLGRLVPVDRAGHELRDHEIEFIGADQPVVPFDHAAIDRCARGESPLGMPPERWAEWQSSLHEALIADGIDPRTVDIRMKGSAAEFFSGAHKSMPTVDSLAADLLAGRISPEVHDSAVATLSDWLARGEGDLPTARPFDTMYRLGLEPERSDYDLNFSSDTMFRRGLAGWDEATYGGINAHGDRRMPVSPTNHGYLDKAPVVDEFPHLKAWAQRWGEELGREMSYAVFLSRGPDDTTLRPGNRGISVHFRDDTDWIIQRAEES
jgi:hypothetical protein